MKLSLIDRGKYLEEIYDEITLTEFENQNQKKLIFRPSVKGSKFITFSYKVQDQVRSIQVGIKGDYIDLDKDESLNRKEIRNMIFLDVTQRKKNFEEAHKLLDRANEKILEIVKKVNIFSNNSQSGILTIKNVSNDIDITAIPKGTIDFVLTETQNTQTKSFSISGIKNLGNSQIEFLSNQIIKSIKLSVPYTGGNKNYTVQCILSVDGKIDFLFLPCVISLFLTSGLYISAIFIA